MSTARIPCFCLLVTLAGVACSPGLDVGLVRDPSVTVVRDDAGGADAIIAPADTAGPEIPLVDTGPPTVDASVDARDAISDVVVPADVIVMPDVIVVPDTIANPDLATHLIIEPAGVQFPTVDIGGSSEAKLLVKNAGGAATMGPVTTFIEGPDAIDFVITSNGCMGPLGVAGSCTVIVRFGPQKVGTRSASLVAAADGRMVTAPLSGLARDPTANQLLSPRGMTFPSSFIGADPAETTFTLTNRTTALAVPAVTISGFNDKSFTISGNGCPPLLAEGGSCKIAVQFAPMAIGLHSATLSATLGMTSDNVPLRGSAAAAVQLNVTPPTASIPKNGTQQFRATLTTADGATHDVTTKVTWSSSEPINVSISNASGSQGVALGITANGASVIRANLQGLSGMAMISVTQ
jgi:hypothetical protein